MGFDLKRGKGEKKEPWEWGWGCKQWPRESGKELLSGKGERRARSWSFFTPASRGERAVWAWGERHGVQSRAADP